MSLNRNNSFYSDGLRSRRDRLGIEQELDRIRNGARSAYTVPDKGLYRSASMGSAANDLSAVGNTTNAAAGTLTPDEEYEEYRKQVNNWYGAGKKATLNDLATKAWNTNGFNINTTPYARWKNYGTGELFKDNFELNQTNDAVRGYYGNTKNLADSEYEAYKRAAEEIARQGDAISNKNQIAYIAKQQQLRNAREQNMALGRGGLGTSEAGYNRINTAYENQRNAAIKQGNEIADDTLQAYEDFIKATRVQADNYENAARDSHGAYILGDLNRYLNGSEDGSKIGMLDALSDKKINYRAGDTDYTVNGYLEAAEEQRLKDYVNKVKGDNAYFYGGAGKKDADTVFREYYDLIEGQGSKNADYQNYLKWDTEQKKAKEAQTEQAKISDPSYYGIRGAVANINVAKRSDNMSKKSFILPGKNYEMTYDEDISKLEASTKIFKKNYPDLYNKASNGDVFFDRSTKNYYVCLGDKYKTKYFARLYDPHDMFNQRDYSK